MWHEPMPTVLKSLFFRYMLDTCVPSRVSSRVDVRNESRLRPIRGVEQYNIPICNAVGWAADDNGGGATGAGGMG